MRKKLLIVACFAILYLSGCQDSTAQIPTNTEGYIEAEHPTLQLTQEDLDIMWDNMLNPETVQIFINGEVVDAPTPFINREAGFVMVPIAAVAEALGYDVFGEGDEIMVGRGATFTIGEDYYFYGRMAGIQLGTAPKLYDNVVFVPLHFFGTILSDEAYVADGNIFINNYTEKEIHPDQQPTTAAAEIPDTIPDVLMIGDMVLSIWYTALDLSDKQLTEEDIEHLRYMVNLTWLDLSGNAILDISQTPIPQLTDLKHLNLSVNRITDEWHRGVYFLEDISALANLTNLTELNLSNNSIVDISPLANLTNLTTLYLTTNHIEDISSLAGLTNLENLQVNGLFSPDLNYLTNLTNLHSLGLAHSRLDDISPLANLTNLKWLDISGNHFLDDISPLSGLINLRSLSLANAAINDLTPLAGLTNLLWLSLSDLNWGNDPLTDLSPLANLTNLETLVIYGHGNHITDWSPVAHVSQIIP